MQRRLDLLAAERYELERDLKRFRSMERMAREMGAGSTVIAQWQQICQDIEDELKLRQEEDELPF